MRRKPVQFAATFAAFLCGVACGWLFGRTRASPPRSYDREAAAEAKDRAMGSRWVLENWKRGHGGTDTA